MLFSLVGILGLPFPAVCWAGLGLIPSWLLMKWLISKVRNGEEVTHRMTSHDPTHTMKSAGSVLPKRRAKSLCNKCVNIV